MFSKLKSGFLYGVNFFQLIGLNARKNEQPQLPTSMRYNFVFI